MAFQKINLTDAQKQKYAKAYMKVRSAPKREGKVKALALEAQTEAGAESLHPSTIRNWAVQFGLIQ